MNNDIIKKITDNVPEPVFGPLQEKALALFSQLGLPDAKNEQYRKLDLEALFERRFDAAGLRFQDTLLERNYEGAVVCDLQTFCAKYPAVWERYFSALALGVSVEEAKGTAFKDRSAHRSALMALNTAFCWAGRVVYLPKNTFCEEPILVDNSVKGTVLGYRDIVIAEEGAQAKIVLRNGAQYDFLNRVCEVFVAQNAVIEIVEYDQSDRTGMVTLNSFMADISRGGSLTHFSVNTLVGVTRNNLKASLSGPGAAVRLYGAAVVREDAFISNATVVEHLVERCESSEHYKNIVFDNGVSEFNGAIFVDKDAQRTAAFQQNNNVVLSDTAKAFTKPQLEIYADDVKCSHGATVGQLNPDALFYMRQRGISESAAKRLLTAGFVNDVVMKISNETVRETVYDEIRKKL